MSRPQTVSYAPIRLVTVYRAVLIAPPARYDVAVLVETTSVEALAEVTAAPPCRALVDAVHYGARDVVAMTARCVRCVADVDKGRPGLFLFNHFVADDLDAALDVWERLAAWYAAETAMGNSTLLAPVEAADYVFVNHARWDVDLPRFALAQFGSRTFRSDVIGTLRSNDVVALPILYRRV